MSLRIIWPGLCERHNMLVRSQIRHVAVSSWCFPQQFSIWLKTQRCVVWDDDVYDTPTPDGSTQHQGHWGGPQNIQHHMKWLADCPLLLISRRITLNLESYGFWSFSRLKQNKIEMLQNPCNHQYWKQHIFADIVHSAPQWQARVEFYTQNNLFNYL